MHVNLAATVAPDAGMRAALRSLRQMTAFAA
jgi:hypothetical protein